SHLGLPRRRGRGRRGHQVGVRRRRAERAHEAGLDTRNAEARHPARDSGLPREERHQHLQCADVDLRRQDGIRRLGRRRSHAATEHGPATESIATPRRRVAMRLVTSFTLAAVASLLAFAPSLASAQASPVLTEQPEPDGTPVPRTPDGRADLSGVWNKAIHLNMAAPVEPLPFTPAGLKAYNEVAVTIDPTARCILPGVPRVNNSPYPMQIVQLPDKVIFLYEYMHNFRVINTDGRGHREDWESSLMGDSIGRWAGDTLVIVTVDLSDRTLLDVHGNVHSPAL